MIDKLNTYLCTGCTACASICPKKCITLQKNKEGFNYPVINFDECIECNLCEKACPILTSLQVSSQTSSYAVMNNDETVRLQSTSGGMFTLLAKYVLSRGGYVVGVAYDDSYTVRHIIVDSEENLGKLRGAKYSQSELGDIFIKVKELLDKDYYVLFSGTPCQVGGLKGYLRKEYDKLITVDLICHGVPSPMVWNKYLEYRNKDTIKSINLRSKITGWSNYSYSVVFDYGDKQYGTVNYNDVFMKAFVGNYCLRESCSNCHFKGIDRVSDFTLGDYWGVWNQHPELDDNKGTSIVFIHSHKAKEIFNSIEDTVKYLEIDCENAVKMNPSMLVSSKANDRREEFIEDIYNNGFTDETSNKYFPVVVQKSSLLSRVKGKVKRVLKG